MAYIGKTPIVGNFQKCDALSASGTADYTLQVGSTNVSPESVNHMIVSLNGVIQSPTTAYTVSGAVLSFASALTTSDTIDFVMLLGNVLDIGTPSDNVVSTAKIVDDAVTAAKINTDIISGTTALAVAPADTDEFLVSDAGTLKRIDYSLIKGGGKFESELLHVSDEKSQGTSGGTISTSTWTKTDLNTVKTNEITSASLSSSVISLPAGTYFASGYRINYQAGGTRIRLRDTTNSADKVVSLSVFNKDGSQISHPNPFAGRFTLSGTVNLELQIFQTHNNSGSTNALGDAGSISGYVERYSDLMIWGVA